MPTRELPVAREIDNRIRLRIMETTDLHMHLLPYDCYADRDMDGFGLIQLASAIQSAREENPNSLLFDNASAHELSSSRIGHLSHSFCVSAA